MSRSEEILESRSKEALVLDKSVFAMASMDISDRGRLDAGMSLLQRSSFLCSSSPETRGCGGEDSNERKVWMKIGSGQTILCEMRPCQGRCHWLEENNIHLGCVFQHATRLTDKR